MIRGLTVALLGTALALATARATADDQVPAILPWPRSITTAAGTLSLGPKARVVATDPRLEPLARVLADEFTMATGWTPAVAAGAPAAGDIVLKLDPALEPENYTLTVGDSAVVAGGDYTGTALGTVSLLQAVKRQGGAVTLPRITVEDGPQSKYCGTMLDVARCYNSIDVLRQCVVLCRLAKIRYFHLHLTDDQAFTFPSKAYPKLGTSPPHWLPSRKGPVPYAREDLEALVRFADERGVTIVPELEVPGHSGVLQREMPEVFCMKDPATGKFRNVGVIDITSERIYPVLDTLVGEMCEVFKSSPYVHTGGDECWWVDFEKTEEAKKFIAEKGWTFDQLQGHFYGRMKEIVKRHGKKMICWEGYANHAPADADVVVMAWGAGHKSLLDRGFKIINVPWTVQIYSSVRANYEWNLWLACPEFRKPEQLERTDGIIGAEMVLWQRPGEDAVRLLRLKAPARNERVYNPDAERSFEDFQTRLEANDRLLEALLFPVRVSVEGLRKLEGAAAVDGELAVLKGENNLFADALTVRLDTPIVRPGETVHYTTDGTEPTPASPRYAGPFTLTERDTTAWQPDSSFPAVREAAVKARLFAGDAPRGETTVRYYHFDYIGKLPRRAACSLYEIPADMKSIPADGAGMTLVYKGLEPSIDVRAMPHVRRPRRYVAVWEGTLVVDEPGDYEFQLRSTGGTSQLFLDGKLCIDRVQNDWSETLGTVHLEAGRHPLKTNYCGDFDWMTLHWRPVGQKEWKKVELAEIGATK